LVGDCGGGGFLADEDGDRGGGSGFVSVGDGSGGGFLPDDGHGCGSVPVGDCHGGSGGGGGASYPPLRAPHTKRRRPVAAGFFRSPKWMHVYRARWEKRKTTMTKNRTGISWVCRSRWTAVTATGISCKYFS